MVEKKARGQEDFIEYFGKQAAKRHKNDYKSVGVNWDRAHDLLKMFNKNKPLPFAQIDMHLIESVRDFLLNAPRGGKKEVSFPRILHQPISRFSRQLYIRHSLTITSTLTLPLR
jgi:hypothetical protein